jgi:hypothetical protein
MPRPFDPALALCPNGRRHVWYFAGASGYTQKCTRCPAIRFVKR